MGTIGIPTKLLHESLGHIVTLELKGGQSYRGKLFDAEDNLNCSLKDVLLTSRDGKQSHLDSVYIRGSMIRFIVVPDMLQQAPMFKRVGPNAMKGRGIGAARGRATIMRGMFESSASAAIIWTLTKVLRVMAHSNTQLNRDVAEVVVADKALEDEFRCLILGCGLRLQLLFSSGQCQEKSSGQRYQCIICTFISKSLLSTLRNCVTNLKVKLPLMSTAGRWIR